MSIPFAIHRSGSVVPVGRNPGLHSGCALGLVPASGDLLRFARADPYLDLTFVVSAFPKASTERRCGFSSHATVMPPEP